MASDKIQTGVICLGLQNNRISEIDSLRGIAAFCVMLFHYTTRYGALFGNSTTYSFNFSVGSLGVHLFFIISGFVIFMTISNSRTVRAFAYKRITRLYPAYIVAVTLTFTATTLYNLKGCVVGFKDYLFNLTMLQGVIPKVPFRNVDNVYWSLAAEILFYCFIGFVFFMKLHKKIELVSLFWLVVGTVISILHQVFQTGTAYGLFYYLYNYSLAKYCYLFIAGIMFYKLKDGNKPLHYILISGCLLYCAAFNDVVTFAAVFLFFAIFLLLVKGKARFINLRALRYLGTISYSLYLIHQNIGYVIIDFMAKRGIAGEGYLLIPIGISVLLASLITFLVEKPVQSFVRKHQPKFLTKETSELREA